VARQGIGRTIGLTDGMDTRGGRRRKVKEIEVRTA